MFVTDLRVIAAVLSLLTSLAAAAEVQGVYSVWDEKTDAGQQLREVKGGQIVVQWAQVHPSPQVTDFSAIERKAGPYWAAGRPFTLQVNGNFKPEWLYSEIPYHPRKWSKQTWDEKGTLMFWHPRYIDMVGQMVSGLGDYLGGLDAQKRSLIAGVRLNLNAVGTEHFSVPPFARQPQGWITPEAGQATAFSQSDRERYLDRVVTFYWSEIPPDVPLFVRAYLEEHLRQLGLLDHARTYGLFHTSSAPYPLTEHSLGTYEILCRHGRERGGLVLTESYTASATDRADQLTSIDLSPVQWNYWRLLLDLHCGVSVMTVYGGDLKRALTGTYGLKKYWDSQESAVVAKEYAQAFEFANHYAGWFRGKAPRHGAWIAFGHGTAPGRPLQDTWPPGRYLNLGIEELSSSGQDVYTRDYEKSRYGPWGRSTAPGEKLVLRLTQGVGFPDSERKVSVRVVARAESGGRLYLDLDGARYEQELEGTGEWEELAFDLVEPGADSGERQDRLFHVWGEGAVVFHMVEVFQDSAGLGGSDEWH